MISGGEGTRRSTILICGAAFLEIAVDSGVLVGAQARWPIRIPTARASRVVVVWSAIARFWDTFGDFLGRDYLGIRKSVGSGLRLRQALFGRVRRGPGRGRGRRLCRRFFGGLR